MILSRKYKEQMDSIFMTKDVKKRILHNTLNSDKQHISEKNNKNSRPYKRYMGALVACLSILICINLRGFFLKLFSLDNNKNTNNIEMKHNEDVNDKKDTVDNNLSLYKNTREINKSNIEDKSNSHAKDESKYINNDAKNNSMLNEDSDFKNKIIELPEKEISEANEALNENIEKSENNQETEKIKIMNHSDNSSSKNDGISTASHDGELLDNNQKSILREISPNIKQVSTVEDAEKDAGFKFKLLKIIPEGFDIYNISVIPNNMVKIDYKNEENILSYTIENNMENTFKESSLYPFEKNININDISVNMIGDNNNLIYEARWNDNNVLYSIYNSNGINENDLNEIIKNIK